MGLALDAGAEDFQADDHGFEILAETAQFEPVHHAIEAAGIKAEVAHVTWLPMLTIPVENLAAAEVQKLIEALEDHDDVKEVFHNADLPVSPS
jgi:transcriptional/translational regulatory protein YebC/TACO1